MQPNRIGIPFHELINIHAFYCNRTPDAFLLAIHENGHELLPSLLPLPLLSIR
jgi:hypothetical protein